MTQRHPNDDTVTLPPGHTDPASPQFVPIPLREAFAAIDTDTEQDMRRQLYSEISEPFWRTIAGRPVVLNHRSSETDFAVALTWLKLDHAARRVARDNERVASAERDRRNYTCGLCGRYDRTANNTGLAFSGIPRIWCQSCRDEWRRQEVVEHAASTVNGTTVADLIGAARQQAARP